MKTMLEVSRNLADEQRSYMVTIRMYDEEGTEFFHLDQLFPDRMSAKLFMAQWSYANRNIITRWRTA